MASVPKPTRTPRKPRKAVPRVSGRPRKKKRSRGKRATDKAILARCDKLWSLIVRSKGYCEVRQWFPHVCKGPLQAMHGIPRTYKATRWNLLNGFAGCAGAHLYLTWRPEEWSRYLVKAWGPEAFEELWVTARRLAKPDAAAILAALEAEASVRFR